MTLKQLKKIFKLKILFFVCKRRFTVCKSNIPFLFLTVKHCYKYVRFLFNFEGNSNLFITVFYTRNNKVEMEKHFLKYGHFHFTCTNAYFLLLQVYFIVLNFMT